MKYVRQLSVALLTLLVGVAVTQRFSLDRRPLPTLHILNLRPAREGIRLALTLGSRKILEFLRDGGIKCVSSNSALLTQVHGGAMSQRSIKELRPDVLEVLNRAQASGLTSLDLDGCGLTEIPDQIFALTHLESLDLSDNSLKHIPDRLWKLPNLQSVNLIGNPIASIPNRPGLTIDLEIYCRCYAQIDATNINLFVGTHILQEDAGFLAKLKAARGLTNLAVGQLNL